MNQDKRQDLFVWILELEFKRWPDHSLVRHLRPLLIRTVPRLMIGAATGLVLGTFSAVLGICLARADLGNPSTFDRMVRMVSVFALSGTVLLAFVFDFMYYYLKFLTRFEAKRGLGQVEMEHRLWDGEIDGLPSPSEFGEEDEKSDPVHSSGP